MHRVQLVGHLQYGFEVVLGILVVICRSLIYWYLDWLSHGGRHNGWLYCWCTAHHRSDPVDSSMCVNLPLMLINVDTVSGYGVCLYRPELCVVCPVASRVVDCEAWGIRLGCGNKTLVHCSIYNKDMPSNGRQERQHGLMNDHIILLEPIYKLRVGLGSGLNEMS